MPKYRVCKQRVEYRSAILEVEAADEDEAEALADESFDELPDEEWGIDNAEESVLSVEPIPLIGASSEETPKPEWDGTEDESVNTTECPNNEGPIMTWQEEIVQKLPGYIFTVESDPDNDGYFSVYADKYGAGAEVAGKIGERCVAEAIASSLKDLCAVQVGGGL